MLLLLLLRGRAVRATAVLEGGLLPRVNLRKEEKKKKKDEVTLRSFACARAPWHSAAVFEQMLAFG